MHKKEDTPFVIDFKPGSYGTAVKSHNNKPSTSQQSNNNDDADIPSTTSYVYCLHGKDHVEVRDHCHRQRSEGVDIKARKKLIIASVLCLLFMICEIIGGVLSNSLAIATDAAHLLTDFASFMISLFAIWIAGRPSTQRMSFGWYRAEVIGALASVVMIYFITAILVWLAIQRLITKDFELNAGIMLITSGLAILVNLIMGFQLHHGHSHGGTVSHSHSHTHAKTKKNVKNVLTPSTVVLTNSPKDKNVVLIETIDQDSSAATLVPDSINADAAFSYQNTQNVDEVKAAVAGDADAIPSNQQHASAAPTATVTEHHKDVVNMNVRAAFIHVLGDMVQSVGVFIAAIVIYFRPDWAIVDPICTFIFSIIVLITTFSIMKDALLVLMEGTPSYMHYAEVLNTFQQIDGVKRVHNLRIWALSINKIALSVHLAIAPNTNPKKILQDATTVVHKRYNFFETTIQIEDFTPDMETCAQCSLPAR